MREIKIKRGRHLASNQFTGIRTNLFGSGNISAIVCFDVSSEYLTVNPDNQRDWNKLFGCSWGFSPLTKQLQMHENSSRWVWRYLPDEDVFEIAPYIYVDGLRMYPENSGFPSIKVKHGKLVYLSIVPSVDEQKVHFSYSTSVINSMFDCQVYGPRVLCTLNQNIPSIAGFIAPGYFGGNEVAPNDIKYKFEREK